jgi:hypothetical protein
VRPWAAREAERRQRRDRLAGARLADDPERRARLHPVGDAVDGVHDTIVGIKRDAQVLDGQQRLAHS